MIAAARHPSTPYARRLARERGLQLELIAGSGPNGRIVAADVEAFATSRAAAAKAMLGAAPVAAVSAFAVTIDLAALHKMLEQLVAADVAVDLNDMFVRAAGLALTEMPAVDKRLAWEVGGADRRLAVIEAPHQSTVTALHLARAAAIAAAASEGAPATAILSIRVLAAAGIRPVTMPLLGTCPLRLVISAPGADGKAEALLSFDAATVSEDIAAAFLARFRHVLESPFALLA